MTPAAWKERLMAAIVRADREIAARVINPHPEYLVLSPWALEQRRWWLRKVKRAHRMERKRRRGWA